MKTFFKIWLVLTFVPVILLSIWWLFFVDISQPTPEERYAPRSSTSLFEEK